MSPDPELARLRELFPVGSRVRTGPGLVDKGPHEVTGHTRMERPFRRPMLLLNTPHGETVQGEPERWRHDDQPHPHPRAGVAATTNLPAHTAPPAAPTCGDQ